MNSVIPAERPRRSFLTALTAAFVAAPVVMAAPAMAAKVEDPELLELGEELSSRLATYREAAARFAAVREHYERIKPVVPAALIVSPNSRRLEPGLAENESDIDGKEVQPPRKLYDRRNLQVFIIMHDVPGTTRDGRRLRRLARLAKAYEVAKDVASNEAGYPDARHAVESAAGGLACLAHRLSQAEPATLTGARIIAEAAAGIWEAREHIGSISFTHAGGLGVHLAQTLLRLKDGGRS